jgi:hypothetical protein
MISGGAGTSPRRLLSSYPNYVRKTFVHERPPSSPIFGVSRHAVDNSGRTLDAAETITQAQSRMWWNQPTLRQQVEAACHAPKTINKARNRHETRTVAAFDAAAAVAATEWQP